MNWLWAYFRRKVAEAIRAGVHDALTSGAGATDATDEQASQALRAILGTSDSPAPGVPPAEAGTTQVPQLPAPGTNGEPALTDQPKRPVGRPRKFQEPPQ